MAVYQWAGINAAGKNVKGVQDADSPKAVKSLLRKDGILVTEVLEDSEARKKKSRDVDLAKLFKRTSALDVAVSTRQLSTLLHAGIPLVEALTALIDQLDQGELKSAFTQIRDHVNEGKSFADSLKEHPKLFGTLYVNMVAAGEASGTLEVVLGRLSEFLESQNKLKSKVVSAMAYPAFMGLMALGTTLLMMVVVVPKITSIFDDFKKGLPWYTNLMIWTSDLLINWWWLLILLFFGFIFAFRRWKSSEKGKIKWDLFVLAVPIVGKIALMVAITRFARTLSTLLSSNVPVLRAMEITRNVLGNTELMRIIDEARVSVKEGESIAKTLKSSGRFPPIVTHMITIGERSGHLEEMLEHVASTYDQQLDARMTALTSLLEPLMILIMGAVAGGITFSILIPLLKINEFVQ